MGHLGNKKRSLKSKERREAPERGQAGADGREAGQVEAPARVRAPSAE